MIANISRVKPDLENGKGLIYEIYESECSGLVPKGLGKYTDWFAFCVEGESGYLESVSFAIDQYGDYFPSPYGLNEDINSNPNGLLYSYNPPIFYGYSDFWSEPGSRIFLFPTIFYVGCFCLAPMAYFINVNGGYLVILNDYTNFVYSVSVLSLVYGSVTDIIVNTELSYDIIDLPYFKIPYRGHLFGWWGFAIGDYYLGYPPIVYRIRFNTTNGLNMMLDNPVGSYTYYYPKVDGYVIVDQFVPTTIGDAYFEYDEIASYIL